MARTPSYVRWTLASIAFGSLIQCGGGKKSESAQASFEIIPPKPIVITADTTVNGSKVAAPWVRFSVNLTNGSDKPITIIAVTAKIYPPNSAEPTTWAQDPASQSSTTETSDCVYSTYGVFQPNESKPLELPGTGVCNVKPHAFYVGGLKTPPGASYRYRVVLKPIGWFGTPDAPMDRFDAQVTFTTQ